MSSARYGWIMFSIIGVAFLLAAILPGYLNHSRPVGLVSLKTPQGLTLPKISGAYNAQVKQTTLGTTVCHAGWTSTIRPPVSYTQSLKLKQIRELGYVDTNPKDYEEDHFIPLELGGNPTKPTNLWPEPWEQARRSDLLENQIHRDLCNNRLKLFEAHRIIRQFKLKNG